MTQTLSKLCAICDITDEDKEANNASGSSSWFDCLTGVDSTQSRRPPDHRKETQTALVWSCLPFTRSGQNHLARHSERGKKSKQTEEKVGRQHQGMDRPGVRQVPEGSGEQGKMEKTGCKIIRGAPTTLAVMG